MTTIETERLVLRPFRENDIPAYAAIRRKPGVTRYLPSHSEDSGEADRRAASVARDFMALWEDPGYGPWAVIRDGALIGHLGLHYVPEKHVTELLYLLDPAAQRQGYATEGARAALAYGFGTLGLDRVVAWAMPENAASQEVMERLGMVRHDGHVTVFGIEAVEYEMTRARWAELRGDQT